MKKVADATPAEMVLAFLQGEIDSPNFGKPYVRALDFFRMRREVIIDKGDPNDADQNGTRDQLLDAGRGYLRGSWLFTNFPTKIRWIKAQLDSSEVSNLKYGNFPAWVKLSGGTRRVGDAALKVAVCKSDEAVKVKSVAEALKSGKRYAPLIALDDGSGVLMLLEGHSRATAYAYAKLEEPVEAIVGSSPNVRNWRWY